MSDLVSPEARAPQVAAWDHPLAEPNLEDVAFWRVVDLALYPGGSCFRIVGPREYRIDCPLAGEHQVANAVTAVVVE